jgi:2-octaprenyl-6-methoxyphenol hydroxylase
MKHSTLFVIGAGPVGAAFALLAHAHGQPVRLIDARPDPRVTPLTEMRTLALSHGSQQILTRAGLDDSFWQDPSRVASILSVHTSQQGGFGRVRLTHEDAGVPALGHVVRYGELQQALDAAIARAGLAVEFGARVLAIDAAAGAVRWQRDDGSEADASAAWVVLADGGANLDKLPGISTDEKDYGQSALLGHVRLDRAHNGVAYERFTATGPLALLPSPGAPDEMSLVWVDLHAAIDARMAQTDQDIAQQFATAFGARAGGITTFSGRRRYPLKLRQASRRMNGRVAIIGNAAQAMHPVAGQGFNLGLRDAARLAELVGSMAPNLVQLEYRLQRAGDVSRGVAFTDLLASGFLGDGFPLRAARGSVLAAVDLVAPARRALARRMLFGSGA